MEEMVKKERVKQFMNIKQGSVIKDTYNGDLLVVAQVGIKRFQLIVISSGDFGNRYVDDSFTKEDLILELASDKDLEYFGDFEDYLNMLQTNI